MKKVAYKLEELCDIKSGKRLPVNCDFSPVVTDFPYIRARDIKGGKISVDDLVYIEQDVQAKISKYIIETGDIAITIVGASVGDIGFADEVVHGYNLTENAVRLTQFNDKVYNKYLFYTLFQRQYRAYMQLIAGAAAQPKLGIYKIRNIRVELPDRDIQVMISSILSAYDDLIENNNRRIKILEQMAENLYKEWFVRFRFPGYEQAEFENGIPKGWKACKLREIIRIRYGKDHKDLEDGTIPVFGSGGVMRYGNRALYSGETVMIPRKGSLHNVTYYKGDLWTVDTMFYTEFKVPNCASYLYFTLSQFDLESLNKGASIPSLSTDILYNLKIVLPPQWLLTQFQQMIDVINAQTEKLTQQNHNLTKQRDMLLPRLMSGKLEV